METMTCQTEGVSERGIHRHRQSRTFAITDLPWTKSCDMRQAQHLYSHLNPKPRWHPALVSTVWLGDKQKTDPVEQEDHAASWWHFFSLVVSPIWPDLTYFLCLVERLRPEYPTSNKSKRNWSQIDREIEDLELGPSPGMGCGWRTCFTICKA